jgi:hypothetical protein
MLFSVNKNDVKKVESALISMDCPDSFIDEGLDNIYYSEKNVGFTYSNKAERKSLIVISETDSIGELLNTLMHECYHLANHIILIDGDEEEKRADIMGSFIQRISRQLVGLINSL